MARLEPRGESCTKDRPTAPERPESAHPTGIQWLSPPGIRRQTRVPIEQGSAEEQSFGRQRAHPGNVGCTRATPTPAPPRSTKDGFGDPVPVR
jgi:hypothetical protein